MSDGVLTERWRSRLIKKLGCSELLCYKCGEKIEVGSEIHTNANHGRSRYQERFRRIYHAKCFEEMFI